MSLITHYGYGYSKKLCEDVTSWFVNNFYPRHRIHLEIQHRGMKRERSFGYCGAVDAKSSRPRNFLIEIDTHMDEELYTKTLLHELTHMAQWIDGSLRCRSGKLYYCQEPADKWAYEDQPHEIEARKWEEMLYDRYLIDKQGVPPGELVRFLPNRLTAA